LHQKVEQATRGENVLDLVFCDDENLVENIMVGESLGNSDHQIIRFDINVESNKCESNVKMPNFRKANFKGIRRDLAGINWEQELGDLSINDMWSKFESKLKQALKSHIPHAKKKANRFRNKWVSNSVKTLLRDKNLAYQQMKKTSSDACVHKYVTIRREVKREIRKCKRSYEEHIAEHCKENPKEFFNYVRSKKSVKETIGPLQDNNGELVHDKTNMANILNDNFSAVFTKEDTESIPTPHNMFQGNDANRLTEIKVSSQDVEKVLNKLKVNKSPGPDGIHPRVLKEAKDALIMPLKIIFNRSLSEGKVPNDWKKANVTHIFKKGNKKEPANYRPISLTSVICKLLESLIRDQIVCHLEDNSLILNSQHGFRKNRSCLTNLIEFFKLVLLTFTMKGNQLILFIWIFRRLLTKYLMNVSWQNYRHMA
jgi:hypothetical protein